MCDSCCRVTSHAQHTHDRTTHKPIQMLRACALTNNNNCLYDKGKIPEPPKLRSL